jgi:hypothetical protein
LCKKNALDLVMLGAPLRTIFSYDYNHTLDDTNPVYIICDKIPLVRGIYLRCVISKYNSVAE